MPFKDMSKIKVLGDGIYLYENCLSEDELKLINNYIKSLKDDDWYAPPPHPIPHVSPKIDLVKIIIDKVYSLIDGYTVHHNEVLNRLKVGDEWGAHADNAEFQQIREKSKLLKDGDPFNIVDNTAYGIIVYLNNDYEGGEIYYSKQNIEHKPNPGDLLIHSSEEKCTHGVRRVRSENRYAWTSRLSNQIKIPIE